MKTWEKKSGASIFDSSYSLFNFFEKKVMILSNDCKIFHTVYNITFITNHIQA